MSDLLSPSAARRVFLVLTATRWLPVGMTIGILTLFQLERGLSVAQALTVSAVSGWVVLLLELPTSSFADVFGRRPVYLAAAVVNVVTALVYLAADSFWLFALSSALMGVFRALDSGPLEAWFVDTVHLTEPGADVDGALARQGTVLGGGIALGALISGGLVWWHPVEIWSALTLPVLVFAGLNAVHLVTATLLMHEPRTPSALRPVRRAADSARQAPAVVREGLGLLRTNHILRGLLLVEVCWSVAMVVFESFQPIRLAELVGGEEEAGALMGPVAAGGWAVFALGSAVAGWASKRYGVARTAIAARVLNSLGAVVMGLVAGPAALIAAYLVTYSLHGSSGPVHGTLLHREASAGNRATVLSMNSMMAFAAFGVAAPSLGLLAEAVSTQAAMVAGGVVGLIGAWFYLPALRHERDGRARAPVAPVASGP